MTATFVLFASGVLLATNVVILILIDSQTPSTPTNPITAKDLLITEYDDMLTARIIEKIIVKSRQDLEIIFIGGYTQQISLQ